MRRSRLAVIVTSKKCKQNRPSLSRIHKIKKKLDEIQHAAENVLKILRGQVFAKLDKIDKIVDTVSFFG